MAKPTKSRPTKALSTKPPPTSSSNAKTKPPTTPFTTPSPGLSTLLSTFSPSHIYILHLDPTPPSHRRKIFLVPLVFNTLLLLLLTYRLYTALPTYLALFASIIGYSSSATLNLSSTPLAIILKTVGTRTAIFTFDFLVLGRYASEWPLRFFWGEGNEMGCLGWRVRVGLEDDGRGEVVIRRGRRWADDIVALRNTLLLSGSFIIHPPHGQNGMRNGIQKEEGEEGGSRKIIIETAVERKRLKTKSGLELVDTYWELYYEGMVTAHTLLNTSSSPTSGLGLQWEEFQKGPIVAVFDIEEGEWMIWRPWDGDGKVEEENGGKLRLFKDLLTAMGREGLFFRWVESMQFEGSGEGRRREKMVRVSRELFEGEGVSWEEVVDGIGGLEGLFGMEVDL
ncbi:MAG: hypothetical protein Q9221_004738 [Calogaya cf. arnoldii]